MPISVLITVPLLLKSDHSAGSGEGEVGLNRLPA